MGVDLQALQQQAIELMKRADFGEESIRVNTEIVQHLPADGGIAVEQPVDYAHRRTLRVTARSRQAAGPWRPSPR